MPDFPVPIWTGINRVPALEAEVLARAANRPAPEGH
jgi:hypothetical protein